MSAPRKIWVADDGLNSPDSRSWSATVPVGPAYHHDDVVRELVDVLEALDGELKEHGYDVSGHMRSLVLEALAKIAQHDL